MEEEVSQKLVLPEKLQLVAQAREHYHRRYLYLGSDEISGAGRLPVNLETVLFSELNQLEQVRDKIDWVHLETPIGSALSVGVNSGNRDVRQQATRELINSLYPLVKPGGQITVTDYWWSESKIHGFLVDTGFVPTVSYDVGGIGKFRAKVIYATKP